MASIKSYRDLKVWNVGMDLSVLCYRLTKAFPREEQYGLTSQIRRASVSIPANVAEGHGRRTRTDYLRFVYNAQGSLKELETLLELSHRVGFLADQTEVSELCAATGQLLSGLIRSLGKQPPEPQTPNTEPRS